MLLRRLALFPAIGLLLSCGGGESTGPAKKPIAVITVMSGATTVKATRTEKLNAGAKDASGTFLPGKVFVWTSSNDGVARVASDGTMSAIAPGSAVITATCEGKSGTLAITVTRAPLASISVGISPTQLAIGQTVQTTLSVVDSAGNTVGDAQISWSSTDPNVAKVSASGAVTALGIGGSRIDARAEGILGSVMITVASPSVASVSVALTPSSLLVGQSGQATATIRDSQGTILTGRSVTWSSSDQSVANITSTGAFTANKAGTITITATADGKTGSSQLSVTAPQASCATNQLSSLAVGEIRTLSSAQKSFFCIAGGSAGSEYVAIPFFNLPVAASNISVRVAGTNTSTPSAVRATRDISSLQRQGPGIRDVGDAELLAREYQDLKGKLSIARAANVQFSRDIRPSRIMGLPAVPAVGAVYQLNANVLGNTCSDPKDLHGARVVSVFPHVIVMVDTLAPAGGYTNAEMASFGQAFETSGYALDTLNFGAPTDVDGNGKVLIFFTPGVNRIPGPPGGFVGGVQTGRDLVPVATCAGSNEGEMFYMPVPDPNKTINGNYSNKTSLANGVLATLVHEFQHLINIGRRIYVSNATVAEEVWLNEGLSHIAEELLYYAASGKTPRSNISLTTVQASQAQVDAFNNYQIQNFGRLFSYMLAPEQNSPFAQNDNLETRGAIWQLLRYSADRKGGSERSVWYPLVNTTAAGQQNFNNIFGSMIGMSRDWAVAQFADDMGFSLAANFTNPSWHYRSLLTAISTSGNFPLFTRSLSTSPIDLTLAGGAASYIRFQVAAGATASLNMTASGLPLPGEVDVTVMRTK